MAQKKRITLLGATGSVGSSVLEVIKAFPDRFELVGIAVEQNLEALKALETQWKVPHIAIGNPIAWKQAKEELLFPHAKSLLTGQEGLEALAQLSETDLVIVATRGTHGLAPTLAALKAGKQVALANKEVLVLAGEWVMKLAKKQNITILPIDSEHNAIFQCLKNEPKKSLDKLILTASGGPFREFNLREMEKITPEMALKHPNWQMGSKITIDSSTLANKGLELIEAYWLFGVREEKIEVVVHPQSIVHSMVQFIDGSILAQMSPTHMTFAIQNSLFYPERTQAVRPALEFGQGLQLSFEAPDLKRFPALSLAREALRRGGSYPAVFNAANEIAVEAFRQNRLTFLQISQLIEQLLEHPWEKASCIQDCLIADSKARVLSQEIIKKIAKI